MAGLHLLLATLVCGLLLSCTESQPEGQAEEFSFKIAVAQDGMVQVDFDALGFSGPPPRTSQLSLTERGQAVGFEVDAGDDGRFGPGDSLSFPGRHL